MTTAGSADLKTDYSVDLVTDAAEWTALFSTVEHPRITQSWAYGEAKQAAADWHTRRVVFDAGGWRARRLVISRRGEPVAICQILDKCVAGVTVGSRLNRGPLLLGPDPGEDTTRDIYRLLKGNAVRSCRPLVLAPALPDTPEAHRLLSELGYRPRQAPGWVSDRVDLRPDEEQLHKNLHRNWCWALRRAQREGVEFRVCDSTEDLEWLLERHVEHMKEKQFVGMQPAFLRALRDAVPAGDDFLVSQVRLADEPIGGLITYRFGSVAEGLILCVGPEARRVNACRFLDWHTALELKRRGCEWFDLGGKRAGATEQFKGGMGGVEYGLLTEWTVL